MPKPISADHLRDILEYDAASGLFYWRRRSDRRENWNARYAGEVAGCIRTDGYVTVRIEGSMYFGHRLAWLWMTGDLPDDEIDHKDTNPSNNRWNNLRQATSTQNKVNVPLRRTNASGVIGVSFYPPARRWRARIKVNGREVALGYFATKDEAAAARAAATTRFHGEFGRSA